MNRNVERQGAGGGAHANQPLGGGGGASAMRLQNGHSHPRSQMEQAGWNNPDNPGGSGRCYWKWLLHPGQERVNPKPSTLIDLRGSPRRIRARNHAAHGRDWMGCALGGRRSGKDGVYTNPGRRGGSRAGYRGFGWSNTGSKRGGRRSTAAWNTAPQALAAVQEMIKPSNLPKVISLVPPCHAPASPVPRFLPATGSKESAGHKAKAVS